jgi:hypothetical protein
MSGLGCVDVDSIKHKPVYEASTEYQKLTEERQQQKMILILIGRAVVAK